MNPESMSTDKLWKRYLHSARNRNVSFNNHGYVYFDGLAKKYYRLWFQKAGYNV